MKNLWNKLKNIKHIEIIVLAIFILLILMIYFSGSKSAKTTTTASTTDSSLVATYIDNLEQKLESSISKLSGVNSCEVVITLDLTGASIENSNITFSSFPAIKGVVVFADYQDTFTKMSIIEALEALIDINRDNIQILKI